MESYSLNTSRLSNIPADTAFISLKQWKAMEHERNTNPDNTVLDEQYPGWWIPTEEQFLWLSKAHMVRRFFNKAGRWPKGSETTEASEATLGLWLAEQRKANSGEEPRLPLERELYLHSIVPGWSGKDREAEWRLRAAELGAFRSNTAAWPRRTGEDTPAHERSLAKWVSAQRQAKRGGSHGWTSARQSYLDEVAPGWEGGPDAEWRVKADVLGEFHQETGSWPNASNQHAPEAERVLGTWLAHQRKAKRNDNHGWSPERQAYLDQVAPGWER